MPDDPALVPSVFVSITNVVPGQTIGLNFPVAVSYSNGVANGGNVTLSCGGSNNPGTPAPGGCTTIPPGFINTIPIGVKRAIGRRSD